MSDGLQQLPSEIAENFGWMEKKTVRKIVAALSEVEPDGVRYVGGCIRDSVIGIAPKDIDIATTLAPDQVVAALKAKGLAAAPTGIEHGTITAIADHQGIEVTTLRADVSTDGRRATVAFTTDWRLDAERRDFTINALYLTPDRRLFDPVGGLADLAARRVRFIGDAEQRIREDYLRILRFFRFSARFADEFDEPGLAACARLKAGIKQLSAERIGDEFSKLLALTSPQAAISAMTASGVLAEIWPPPPLTERLGRLKLIDKDAPSPLGLAALWGEAGRGIDARLRLSNAQADRRKAALKNAALVDPDCSDQGVRALVFRLGKTATLDAFLLAEAMLLTAADSPQARDPRFIGLRALAERWTPPAAPFSGKDILAAGIAQGPSIAEVLKAAETRWINEDFPPADRAHEILREEIARVRG